MLTNRHKRPSVKLTFVSMIGREITLLLEFWDCIDWIGLPPGFSLHFSAMASLKLVPEKRTNYKILILQGSQLLH